MTTQTTRYEIASCSDARKYGEILAHLVKFAQKEGRGKHRIFENIEVSLVDHALRFVASDRFLFGVVDLPVSEVTPPIDEVGRTPALFRAQDVLDLARALRKGGKYDPALDIEELPDGALELTSRFNRISIRGRRDHGYLTWEAVIPAIVDDTAERVAMHPEHLAKAATLCNQLEKAKMSFTVLRRDRPIRIDCQYQGHQYTLWQRARIVVTTMPVPERWDTAAAMDLPPEADSANGTEP